MKFLQWIQLLVAHNLLYLLTEILRVQLLVFAYTVMDDCNTDKLRAKHRI